MDAELEDMLNKTAVTTNFREHPERIRFLAGVVKDLVERVEVLERAVAVANYKQEEQ